MCVWLCETRTQRHEFFPSLVMCVHRSKRNASDLIGFSSAYIGLCVYVDEYISLGSVVLTMVSISEHQKV